MNKAIATTALAAALALSLSGCTFDLLKPNVKPESSTAPSTAPSSDAEPEATDDAEEYPAADLFECTEGEPVTLATDNVIVEYTGTCGDIVITASNVDAQFEQVGNVSVTGDNALISFNGPALDVTVDGMGNLLFGNAMAAITVGGTLNSVSASEATSVATSGTYNNVTWMSGPADGTDTGSGNSYSGPVQ